MTTDDADWITTAEGVLERSPGRDALERLEWDAIGDLRDEGTRLGFVSLFRAQGRVLGVTPALGVLVANRLLRRETTDTALTAVTQARRSDEAIDAIALAGFDEAAIVIVELRTDDGDIEVLTSDRSAWTAAPGGSQAFDVSVARHVQAPRASLDTVAPAVTLDHAHTCRSVARVAIAHEILGVCERLMELAVAYANERHQFGSPIGSFQAVSHLLAEAEVQVRGLRDACKMSMARSEVDGPTRREAVLLKGLAGQTGRTVAQRTLQVFGGIGFTWEHDHHRCSRRMLTLDSLYGSVEEMRARAVRDLEGSSVLRTAVA